LLFIPSIALAEELSFKGKLLADSTSARGTVTIGTTAIEVETRKLFSATSHSFSYSKMQALHVSRGLFYTTIEMEMEGKTIRIRTARRYYQAAKELLQNKM
jgi:hypothetical protein